MKKLRALLFTTILLSGINLSANAQQSDLIKQGVTLHDQGKYSEAISKFEEVLKTDPDNYYANYEIALSLYTLKKPAEAMSHIEKAVKSNNSKLNVAAYCLLASIYDEDNQSQKAINTYNSVIKLDPNYPQIYYNLGVAYFRNRQYAEAENSAIEAIKHDTKNASSQRLYALVTLHQNKRVNALLAFCSFLLLEPNGARAAEAYGNIQHIMQGGVLTDTKGNSTITLSAIDAQETGTLNLGLSMTVLSGEKKKLTGMELFEYELKNIFALAGQLAAKKTDKNFFDRFYASYFYKLSQTDNIEAVVRIIAVTDTRYINAKWLEQNGAQADALSDWIKANPQVF